MGKKTYHHGVNGRVDQSKDPNRRRNVPNTSPHAHHSTGVVIGLQGGALLALGQDNGGVKHLVELGQVENPPQVGQSLIPQTTVFSRIRHTTLSQRELRVRHDPLIGGGVVDSRIAVSTGAIDLAHGIHGAHQAVGVITIRKRVLEGPEHSGKGPG